MAEDFARALTQISVSIACNDIGFQSIQESALQAFVDVVQRYIETIGLEVKSQYELSGRTAPHWMDVLETMDDLGITVPSLVQALQLESPFPTQIPQFPAQKRRYLEKLNAIESQEREPLPSYIPPFLPHFPGRHTYKMTKIDAVTIPVEEKKVRMELLKQKRLVQESLNHLHRGAHATGGEAAEKNHRSSIILVSSDEVRENPYLASPTIKNAPSMDGSALEPYKPKEKGFHVLPRQFGVRKDVADETPTLPVKRQQMSKEDRILTGTFGDGDSD